jgi:hypothetical protein
MPTRSPKRREILLPALLLALSVPAAGFDAGLRAKGSFSVPGARAGDTVEYRLRVEWREVPAALTVLPPRDEVRTPGFRVIGQSALHRKTASAGTVRNTSEFSYFLVAREEGLGRIEPFALRYRDGLSGRVESVPVSASSLEIGPARTPLMRRPAVQIGVAILSVAGIALLIGAGVKNRRSRPPGTETDREENEFTRAVAGLKNRCEAADSRQWLRDAEQLTVAYLCRDLGISNLRDVRFEAALDHYLARKPPDSPGEAESWTKLRDLFHEARYAGGRKEPHELREACRHLKAAMERASGKMENA